MKTFCFKNIVFYSFVKYEVFYGKFKNDIEKKVIG